MSDDINKDANLEQMSSLNNDNIGVGLNSEVEKSVDDLSDEKENNGKIAEQKNKLIEEQKNNTKSSLINVIGSNMLDGGKKKSIDRKTKDISKGYLLEYRLKRLIFSMGYFTKTGILLKTAQDELSDNITDLDVYGFYIHKNFASKTIWADCKAGQAKSLERISWIIGVKSISKIDDVIFVKKGVRYDTRQFARRSGVQVLDLEILESLERDFCIKPDDWRGSWNPDTQMNQLVTFQRINIPNSDSFRKISNFMYSGYWTIDNYSKIKKSLTALKELSVYEQVPLSTEQNKSIHWAIFELINLFVLAVLSISKELYYFSDKDKKETILEGLVSGEISAKKRAEIVEATYKLAYSMIQRQNPNFAGQLNIPKIGLNPPTYYEAFCDLVLRITKNPLNYFDILRFLDFVFMEYDFQSKKLDKTILKSMFPNYESLITSAKTVIHFICTITGIRRELFQLTNQ